MRGYAPFPYNQNMKITINTDARYAETEVIVNCSRLGDDTEKILAALRMQDMKLAGRKDGRQHILEASDIMYVESTDKRAFLYTLSDVYESHLKLYELEVKLGDCDFLRANKSCLFNINHVQSIEPDLDRRLILTMGRDIKLIVSRQYSAAVKKKLEAYHG